MSALEDLLLMQIQALGLPEPIREFRALPGLRYRWDFAWDAPHKVLAEVQGGNWVRGAHARPIGLSRDYEKLNLANLAGWRCFMFDAEMVEDGRAVDTLAKCFGVGDPEE